MKSLLLAGAAGIILSGPGAMFLLYALKKIIDREKLGKWCLKIGQLATAFGRSKFGKAFYEPFEDNIIDTLEWMLFNFKTGANSDDSNGNGKLAAQVIENKS